MPLSSPGLSLHGSHLNILFQWTSFIFFPLNPPLVTLLLLQRSRDISSNSCVTFLSLTSTLIIIIRCHAGRLSWPCSCIKLVTFYYATVLACPWPCASSSSFIFFFSCNDIFKPTHSHYVQWILIAFFFPYSTSTVLWIFHISFMSLLYNSQSFPSICCYYIKTLLYIYISKVVKRCTLYYNHTVAQFTS